MLYSYGCFVRKLCNPINNFSNWSQHSGFQLSRVHSTGKCIARTMHYMFYKNRKWWCVCPQVRISQKCISYTVSNNITKIYTNLKAMLLYEHLHLRSNENSTTAAHQQQLHSSVSVTVLLHLQKVEDLNPKKTLRVAVKCDKYEQLLRLCRQLH